jgi:hypothetical protein
MESCIRRAIIRGAQCIAVFDRARAKVEINEDLRLDDHAHWPAFVRDFDVVINPA